MKLPRKMSLELTSKCNFRCPYCYCVWHEFPELGENELSTEEWICVLKKCAADGVRDVTFTGGEVFLRKDLWEILKAARQILPRTRLSIFTNASLMSEEDLKRLKRMKISVATSLQGLVSYGAMTGTRRSARGVLEVLEAAREMGWPIAVSMTVTKANVGEAEAMFSAAVLSGASGIVMGAMMAEGRGKAHLDLMLEAEEWEGVKARIRGMKDLGVGYSLCDERVCTCREQPRQILEKWGEAAKHSLAISAKRNSKVRGLSTGQKGVKSAAIGKKVCPAGKEFGVVGVDGKFRECLHTVARREVGWEKFGVARAKKGEKGGESKKS
jgi:MoaA/NifB/PqqE/SkfB family radical SAM enzyme